MKLELRDRSQLVLQLVVAEILARPGQGPLTRRTWLRRPRPPAAAETASPPELAGPPTPER